MWLPDIPYPSVFISYPLSFFLSLFSLPPLLLMLFQVFYLHSITTKNKSLSGDVSLGMLCLLAVFIAYTAHYTILPPPPRPSWCVSMSWLPLFSPCLMCFRLFLKSHSGTAGRQSSLVIHGADFSTKDMDNDNCMCKCALMLTGGKCIQTQHYSDANHSYHGKQALQDLFFWIRATLVRIVIALIIIYYFKKHFWPFWSH